MKRWTLLGLLAALMLAACARPATPTVAEPATPTTAVATATQPAATSTPADTASAAATTDWLNTATVEGDYYILGNPAAPVRLTDFSDFL